MSTGATRGATGSAGPIMAVIADKNMDKKNLHHYELDDVHLTGIKFVVCVVQVRRDCGRVEILRTVAHRTILR